MAIIESAYSNQASATPAAAGPPVLDTFTDTDGTLLSAHTMDSGNGWDFGAGDFEIDDNAAVRTGSPIQVAYTDATGIGADQRVTGVFELVANSYNCRFYLAARNNDTGAGTGFGYWVEYRSDNDYLGIHRGTAASRTVLTSGSWASLVGAPIADATPYELALVVIGTTVSVEVDGVEVLSITDATYGSGRETVGFQAANTERTRVLLFSAESA